MGKGSGKKVDSDRLSSRVAGTEVAGLLAEEGCQAVLSSSVKGTASSRVHGA